MESGWGRSARRAGRIMSGAALAITAVIAALALAPALLGLQRYVIVSGSMTGTYDRGSLVLDDIVPVASLRVGDVITYRPPRATGIDHLVTHRIHAIQRDKLGGEIFRTKGDANPTADPWTFTLPGRNQARVRAGIPRVGFVLAALSDRQVRIAVIALPAMLIALASLVALWRRLGEEAERRAATGGTA
jgi:signal peptidase I